MLFFRGFGVIMKKIFFIFMVIFCIGSYSVIQADFPGKRFLQATQQKMASTSTFLVNNAWRIAGTACFATATVTTAIIAKNTLEDARVVQSVVPILTRNAGRMLFPLGSSILGLLCFNVDHYIQNIGRHVQNIDLRVQNVSGHVQNINHRVQNIGRRVHNVDRSMQNAKNNNFFDTLNTVLEINENNELSFLHNR